MNEAKYKKLSDLFRYLSTAELEQGLEFVGRVAVPRNSCIGRNEADYARGHDQYIDVRASSSYSTMSEVLKMAQRG